MFMGYSEANIYKHLGKYIYNMGCDRWVGDKIVFFLSEAQLHKVSETVIVDPT